jgi:5-(carboxyamino)imidazole ribonucleotide synthase
MTHVVEPLRQGAKIGILGGGQLGRMLSLAAAQLGFDVIIYEPEPDCPAGRVSASCYSAPWDDKVALGEFAASVDVVTFEFENVPAQSLAHIGAIAPIRPGLKSLEHTQDRLIEKTFIANLGLQTAPFAALGSQQDLVDACAALGPEAILKTRRFGYDGKGQIRLDTSSNLDAIWGDISGQDWIFEGFVDFKTEVSVILARDVNGTISTFDVTQNVHRAGILHTSTVPADIAQSSRAAAIAQATRLAHALDHIGVMAVEFFVRDDGTLIVNEIAPRVHNSGHWTQDGCNTCQFQQHIRAIAGWPLGDVARHASAITMTNLIGDDIARIDGLIGAQGTHLHLYGKRQTRSGRKMGHVNKVGI